VEREKTSGFPARLCDFYLSTYFTSVSPAYNVNLYQAYDNYTKSFLTRVTENEITAKKFNLSSFESWAPHLNLTPMEMSELKDLLGT
jgi:hypothetical protein